MTTTRTRIARPILIAMLVFAAPGLVGCSVAENIVGGVVDEAKSRAGEAVSDALGGAGISTDGQLPTGFPVAAVPLVGDIQGGGSGPDASGWVVRTTLVSDSFASAQAALEAAGYVGSGVNSDADSGFGTFVLAPYTVVLATDTNADGVVTATYIVTPA